MAYRPRGKRDLRIDFLRGLAVAAMVVDHIGGDTPLTGLTGGNRSFVSAAEAFIFLSGTVLGMVYSQRIAKDGAISASRRMLGRAWTLYSSSVGMALAFYALYLFTDLRLWVGRSGADVAAPATEILQILTLRRSFHGSDVLIMYTLLLLVAPLIVYCLHRGWSALVLGASMSIWVLQQASPTVTAEVWPVADSAFPALSWQLLMVLGLVFGFHYHAVTTWVLDRKRAGLFVAGSIALFFAVMWVFRYQSAHLPLTDSGEVASGPAWFDKENLAAGRVVGFLSLAVIAFSVIHFAWAPLSGRLGWFFVPLGQNSLYVYIMHLFVLVGLYNVAPPLLYDVPVTWDPPEVIALGSQVAGLVLVWLMVKSRFLFWLVPR